MAISRILSLNFPTSHLGTIFLIVGYPVFWLEMASHHALNGVTSWVPWGVVALIFSIFMIRAMRPVLAGVTEGFFSWRALPIAQRIFVSIGLALVGLVVLIAGYEATFPIHLTQEFDSLNYHYALMRQHLITGSFAHIPWAADDLFLLPIDSALAPFWFATQYPNKIPQFLFVLCLLAIVLRLAMRLSPKQPWVSGVFILFMVVGSHGIGIQLGTAMLDLVGVYLFFATLDSWQRKQWGLMVIEAAFFIWSKPLVPVHVIMVLLLVGASRFLCQLFRVQFKTFIHEDLPKGIWCWFIVVSLVVAGPFLVKSLYYAGTPLFPLLPGLFDGQIKSNPVAWASLLKASDIWVHLSTSGYGYGKGIVAFIKHWWLIAVPSQGVNNAFDYPLGLPFLLVLGPFLVGIYQDLKKKQLYLMSLLVVIAWGLWWCGPQQARFLYTPLILMMIVTVVRYIKPRFSTCLQGIVLSSIYCAQNNTLQAGEQSSTSLMFSSREVGVNPAFQNAPASRCKMPDKSSTILLIGLVVALMFQTLSMARAYQADFGRLRKEVIRLEDKQLLSQSQAFIPKAGQRCLNYPHHAITYAQVPVCVAPENLPHTLAF